jgi:hypothetical protein
MKDKLIAKGYASDKVEAMDRSQLFQVMAQVMAATAPDPVVEEEKLGAVGGFGTAAATGPPVMGGMTADQFSMWIQWEKEKEERRLACERERFQWEREKQERMLDMQAAQLDSTRAKADADERRTNSLANRAKQVLTTLKDVVGMFPSDPVDITGYFETLEKTFSTFGVANDLKPHILRSRLHEKAKTLVARLPHYVLDDYKELKAFLLKEYQISPLRLKERFYALSKAPDETYTMLATKLKNVYKYYLDSRGGIDSVDKLVSLICADRLKEIIPKPCLDFVLTQERAGWLNEKDVANIVDDYMSSHYKDGNPRVGPYVQYGKAFNKTKFNTTSKASPKAEGEPDNKANSKLYILVKPRLRKLKNIKDL